MRILPFLAGVLLVFLVSCNRNANGKLSFGLDSFTEQMLHYSEAQKYTTDDLFIGKATGIKVHPDGFIVIKDTKSEDQIQIIDLQNGSTELFIKRGQGPLELLSVRDVAIYNDDVWVSGMHEGRVIRLSFNRDLRKFEVSEAFNLSKSNFFRAFPLADNRFLILSDPTSGKRMEIIDNQGGILREAGSFPEIPIRGNFRLNNAFLQSAVTVAPNNEHVAVICYSIDYIDIYTTETWELKKRLRGPLGAEVEFAERETPEGHKLFGQKPLFFMYRTAASHNEMFFVSYNGIEAKSEKDFARRPQRIFSFDWNGQPLKCYHFDFPVHCFDVDWNNKKLYCITENPESEIVIFDI